MDTNLRVGDLDLGALVPAGRVTAVRHEWLGELSHSRRFQVWIAAPFPSAVSVFVEAAHALGGTLAKVPGRQPQRSATGPSGTWRATLSDVSGPPPLTYLVVDVPCTADAFEAGALAATRAQARLTEYEELRETMTLRILMTSIETADDGRTKGYVQLQVSEAQWPEIERWLAERGFGRAGDMYLRDDLSVMHGSGKLWASFG